MEQTGGGGCEPVQDGYMARSESHDGGKTWIFSYPTAIQTRDGKIHVLYITDERKTIMHAVFDENAILGNGSAK